MTPFIHQLLQQRANPLTLGVWHSTFATAEVSWPRQHWKTWISEKQRQLCESGSSDLSLYCVSLPSPRFYCESDREAESSQEEWYALGKSLNFWRTLTHFLWSVFLRLTKKNAFKWKWLCSCFDCKEGKVSHERESELKRLHSDLSQCNCDLLDEQSWQYFSNVHTPIVGVVVCFYTENYQFTVVFKQSKTLINLNDKQNALAIFYRYIVVHIKKWIILIRNIYLKCTLTWAQLYQWPRKSLSQWLLITWWDTLSA